MKGECQMKKRIAMALCLILISLGAMLLLVACDEKQEGCTDGHTFGEQVTISKASCTAEGAAKRVCNACGTVENVVLPALGHAEVVDAAVVPTCTEAGKTEGKHCSVCNTVTVAQQDVAALGILVCLERVGDGCDKRQCVGEVLVDGEITQPASCNSLGCQEQYSHFTDVCTHLQ